MRKVTIVEFFDPNNTEHLEAFSYLLEHKCWPIEFAIKLQEKYSYPDNYQSRILEKITNRLLEFIGG